MILEMVCPFCGAEHNVKVSMNGWFAYVNGALIQNAFPELSPTEREQIISEICPDCQKSIFEEEPA